MTRSRLFASRAARSVLAAGLAIALGQVLTSRPGAADVYRLVDRGLSGLLAGIVDAPEQQPRDLVVNGQPLAFTPYHSARPAGAICRDWMEALAANRRAAVDETGQAERVGAEVAANVLIAPRMAPMAGEGCAVVQLFEGDGEAAMAYVLASRPALLKAGAPRPVMPGATVLVRQTGEGSGSDVLLSRFDDVPAMLGAYAEPAAVKALPLSLRPPAGGQVLGDLGDRGSLHLSRTVVTSARMPMDAWARMRGNLLAREGFRIDGRSVAGNGLMAFQARRGSVEADVHYTPGTEPGEIVEVVEMREPQLAGRTP